MRLTKRPGSPNWHVEGSVGGRRFRKSTGTTVKKTAEALRRKWEREIEDRRSLGDAATRTFAEAVNLYLDKGGSDRFLGPILDALGHDLLAEIDQARLDDLEKELYPKASAATINRQLYTPISAVLMKAATRKWCERPSLERPKGHAKQAKPTDWRTPEEIERLCMAADERGRAMINLFVGLGLREEDMLSRLLSERIYLEHAEARVDIGKTDRPDHVLRLQPRVIATLSRLDLSRDGPVIRTRDGAAYAVGPGYSLNSFWRRLAKKAGIEPLTSHAFRHTWATWHYAMHKDLLKLRDDGGWASVAIVERYAKLAPPDLRERLLEHGWTMEQPTNAVWQDCGSDFARS